MADYKDLINGILGDVTDKLKDVTRGTEAEAIIDDGKEFVRDAGNYAKMKFNIASAQEELRRTYLEIGRLYYEENRDNPSDLFAPLFDRIELLTTDIESKKIVADDLRSNLKFKKTANFEEPLEVIETEKKDE